MRKACKFWALSQCLLFFLVVVVKATADDISAMGLGSGSFVSNQILDKQAQLGRFGWWDNQDWDWYKRNIPFFESPDNEIDETYYYRWQLITEHLVYDSPETGYVISEFAKPVGWSNSSGAICCAFGLQLGEIRWMRNPRYAEDYAHFWYHSPDDTHPRGYSTWFADALWANYLAIGDREVLLKSLPDMEAQYEGWMREHWNPTERMFAWSGMHDGMELNIESRQSADDFAGAESFRPTLNSYVYGDLMAIAHTEELAGNSDQAQDYRKKAEDLKDRIITRLWDPKRQFFISRFAHDEEKDGVKIKAGTLVYEDGKFAGDPHGRELVGFIPWEFNLPDQEKGYEIAWKAVVDPEIFLAPYGLYSAEKHDPLFEVSDKGCIWSGPNWPYADAQTLIAMANVLNNYQQDVITKSDYFKVFKNYATCQRKDEKPYIAEDQDPDTGKWLADTPNHSENYCHSSYNDLLITGLVGLRPRADNVVEVHPMVPDEWAYFALDDLNYHGYDLSIVWDRDGSRYHLGKGLTIVANGKVIGSSPTLDHFTCSLPGDVPLVNVDRPINFAVNHQTGLYPLIKATYSASSTSPENLINGMYYYFPGHPTDRWTTEGSPNPTDSFEIDFGVERPLEWVNLYLLDDGDGQKVRAPQTVELQYWNGSDWQEIPGQKNTPSVWTGHRANTISFTPLSTSRLRITLTPQNGAAVGLTEFEAWGHADLPLAEVSSSKDDLALGAKATASYTFREDRIEQINDGKIVTGEEPHNRWTAYDSPNTSDWVQLDFPQAVSVGRIEIYWWKDNRGVFLPKNYTIQYWNDGQWEDVTETARDPSTPGASTSDEITIASVETEKIRITFEHALPGKTGVTELMVWKK